jgi:hypothetical protein
VRKDRLVLPGIFFIAAIIQQVDGANETGPLVDQDLPHCEIRVVVDTSSAKNSRAHRGYPLD